MKGLIITLLLVQVGMVCAQINPPVGLRCDFRAHPLAVENPSPPFSWRIDDARRGASQTAYQLQVDSTDGTFARPLWDSGRVASRQSQLVPCGGAPMASKGRYAWRVRYWDQAGVESPWSATARFEMAILDPGEWRAFWIKPQSDLSNTGDGFFRWTEMAILPPESAPHIKANQRGHWNRVVLGAAKELKRTPYFRREIEIDRPVRSARLRYAAFGFVEARINGRSVSEDLLDPAVMQYSVAVGYVTHDVTALLRPCRNALGFVLADGWARETLAWFDPNYADLYNTPALRAELEVEYGDGTVEIFPTGESWKQGQGGLLASNHYLGEIHDAALEPKGWDMPGFDDSAWRPAAAFATPVGNPACIAQSLQPQRAIRLLKPVKVSQPQPGVWVFELPETITGFVELKLPAGQRSTVYVRPSEWVWNGEEASAALHHPLRYPDGSVRNLSPGMILCKARSSAVMGINMGAQGIPRGVIGITTWAFKPDGQGAAVWRPKYSPQVMRHIEVTGLDFEPGPDTLAGVLVHNDLPVAHAFDSAEPVFNRLFAAAVSSTLQNTQSMSWDNATERNQTTWPWTWPHALNTAIGDFSLLYRKFLKDQELWVLPSGHTSGQTLTSRAYWYRDHTRTPIHEFPVIDLPWLYLAYYGDLETVRGFFPLVRRYVDFYWAGEKGERYLEGIRTWSANRYGERWKADPDVPSTNTGDHTQQWTERRGESDSWSDPLFVTLGRWINVLRKASWMADKLSELEDRDTFDRLAENIIAAIRAGGLRDPDSGTYGARRIGNDPARFVTVDGNPVSNAIAVGEGIAAPGELRHLADLTAKDLENHYGNAFPGGREWYRTLYLLSRHGHMEQAVDMMRSTEMPAVGFFTERLGLTTIPETRAPLAGGITVASSAQAESHAFANWFVELLCGIQLDPASIGMQDFVIAPVIPSNLGHASLSMESPYGTIRSGWRHAVGRTEMEFSIPANCTATVSIPTIEVLDAGGVSLAGMPGVVALPPGEGVQRFRFQAGEYRVGWPNQGKFSFKE